MTETILTIVLVAISLSMFGAMVYTLVMEGVYVVKENKRIKRSTAFVNPLPDIRRITAEQARELALWPVLDKADRG